MRYQQLLTELRARRIRLVFDGELKYVTPKGSMTTDLLATLKEHKPDLLHDFRERAAIMMADARLPPHEALRLAPSCAFTPYPPPCRARAGGDG